MPRLVLLLATAVLIVGWVSLPPEPVLVAAGPPSFRGHDLVVELDEFGPQGTTAVGYTHGHGVVVQVPLRNAGASTVSVLAVDPFPELLGMLAVETLGDLPVQLAPGQERVIEVTARFTNCEYYTERAVNLFTGATVEVTSGAGPRTLRVDYPREIVLRSPTILGCPERVTDRSARQRLLATDD